MMESVFSFLPSYFSIIFLAKGKISKSVDLFLSHIGPKWCWSIRLQDFKSNMSLEQSNEIVYFCTCWYQKLRVDRKILGWVWPEMVVAILVTKWMDEWMDKLSWISCWCEFRKVKNYKFNNSWVLWSKIGIGLWFQWMETNLAEFFHANTYLKLVSTVFLSNFDFFIKWLTFKNYEKCFLFHLKSSICSQDIQIFVIFSLPFHTVQIQKGKWKWNNLWCHKLACINLQM